MGEIELPQKGEIRARAKIITEEAPEIDDINFVDYDELLEQKVSIEKKKLVPLRQFLIQ